MPTGQAREAQRQLVTLTLPEMKTCKGFHMESQVDINKNPVCKESIRRQRQILQTSDDLVVTIIRS